MKKIQRLNGNLTSRAVDALSAASGITVEYYKKQGMRDSKGYPVWVYNVAGFEFKNRGQVARKLIELINDVLLPAFVVDTAIIEDAHMSGSPTIKF
jgi:hypothetical protein